jgi:hypothetical protein
MLPYATSRLSRVDLVNGAKRAWHNNRGELLASAAMLVALAAVLLFGDEPVALGLVLVVAVVVNAGRILYRAARNVRDDRDYDEYFDSLFSTRRGGFAPPVEWWGGDTKGTAGDVLDH